MPNINLSDNKLKEYLDSYWSKLQKSDEQQKYIAKLKNVLEELENTLLNSSFLDDASSEELEQEIYKYTRELEGPAHINLGKERISENLDKLKRNLNYIITSDDSPFKKAEKIIGGEYKIKYFARSFWTPILQAQYPNILPNWNNKTENFLKSIGVDLSTSTKTISQKYKILSDVFKKLSELDSRLNFHHLNQLMHYGTAVDEGKDLIVYLKENPEELIKEDALQEKIDTYLDTRLDKESARWQEAYKWEVLPELNKKFTAEKITSKNIADKVELLKDFNPQTGSFVHWSNLDDLAQLVEKDSERVAKQLNILLSGKDMLFKRINCFREEMKQLDEDASLGTPLFGYLFAAFNPKKYPIYKGSTFKHLRDLLNKAEEWRSYTIGMKYQMFRDLCLEMGRLLNSEYELKSVTKNGVDVKPGITALDGQDFFYYLEKIADSSVETLSKTAVNDDQKQEEIVKLRFQGFTEETFDYLQTLAKDTSYEAVKPISDEIHRTAVYPLKRLLLDIGDNFDNRDILGLEKETYLTSRLFKANPRFGAYPYIWGALYQKDKSRISSMQFFASIDQNGLTYGIFPSSNEDVIDLLKRNLEKYGHELRNYLPTDFFDEFLFTTDSTKDGTVRTYDNIDGYKDILDKYKETDLSINKTINPEDVLAAGPKLFHTIKEDFEKLVPLYAFGISNDPIKLLERYYDLVEAETEHKISKEEVLSEIFMKETTFDEIMELLQSRRQIILQGPPGTGKTFIAKRLANYLAQSQANVETIQFHPSYAYEDFIEGYRPREEEGFELKDGIFKIFCQKAQAAPDSNFVLIVDEINRGDLAKVFGELMYLLEYRDQEVKLTYSKEFFKIPDNVYLIGTMNTADRSLAIMDYALRRRFLFATLPPKLVYLQDWLEVNDAQISTGKLIDKLRAANEEIAQLMRTDDYAIGHSFFMHEDMDPTTLKRVINYEIKPLLLEYFNDRETQAKKVIQIFEDEI